MTHDYQCVTEEAVASSRLMKARQYVTAETLMMGFVSARRLQNSAGGHATWSCRCICDILVWQNHHVKGILCHVKWPWSIVNVIQAWPTTEIHDMSGKRCQSRYRLLSGGAVRRNSLRCAPFGPPTVSCVLAPARTCLRQAPPTFRGRGLATSAVPHRLTDDMSIKRTFFLEKRCKKTSLFSPFHIIETNGVKSGRFLHRWSDTRLRSSVRARFLRDASPRRVR